MSLSKTRQSTAKITGTLVVDEARKWIGTPYIHQASQCQIGTDCLGLVVGIWRALYGALPQEIPPYSMDWSEVGKTEQLWINAQRYLTPKARHDAAGGDVLLFRMQDNAVAKHLGIQTAIGSEADNALGRFIHAYSGHSVCETALCAPWQRRIVARFSFVKETT